MCCWILSEPRWDCLRFGGLAGGGSIGDLMQWPLLMVAVCFALGILAANAVTVPLVWFLGPALLLTVIAFVMARVRLWLLWPIFVLAGAANCTLRTASIAPDDLRNLLGKEPQEVTIRGRLTETPYQRALDRDGIEQWRTL